MAKRVDYKCDVNLHNRFDIEVIDAHTGEIKQKAVGFNVICNSLWTIAFQRAGTEQGYFNYIDYGSGAGTPSASDTNLFNYVGYLSPVSSSFANHDDDGWVSYTRQAQLGPNDAVGVNITEVGIAYDTGTNKLCTHAMLQDMNGNPISILKTNTDVINIYATVYAHWNQSGDIKAFMGTQRYRAGNYNYTARTALYWLVGHTTSIGLCAMCTKEVIGAPGSAAPVGTTEAASSAGPLTRTADVTNKTMTFSGRFGIDKGNGSGAAFIVLSHVDAGQTRDWGGEPSFVIECGKNSIPAFRVSSEAVGTGDGSTTKFATKYDFPYNATVKVNGVVANNVEVKKFPCASSNLYAYCRWTVFDNATRWTVSRSTADGDKGGSGNSTALTDGKAKENIAYEIGFSSAYLYANSTLYGSNDGTSWAVVAASAGSAGTVNLAAEHQHFKYYRLVSESTSGSYLTFNAYDGKNIIFDTPPAVGDVITIDYDTPYIPKDSDHVYDLTFTLQFGEWQGN